MTGDTPLRAQKGTVSSSKEENNGSDNNDKGVVELPSFSITSDASGDNSSNLSVVVNPMKRENGAHSCPTPNHDGKKDIYSWSKETILQISCPIALVFICALIHLGFMLTWSTKCDSIKADAERQVLKGGNTVIIFGILTGVAAATVGFTREACRRTRVLFNVKHYLSFAACTLLFFIIVVVQKEQYMPPCGAFNASSIPSPNLGTCYYENEDSLPEMCSTELSFRSNIFLDRWKVDPLEKKKILSLVPLLFVESHQMRGNKNAVWNLICGMVDARCDASCNPILLCPSTCDDLRKHFPTVYGWLINNVNYIDYIEAVIGSTNIAHFAADVVFGFLDCANFPSELFAPENNLRCISPLNNISWVADGGNCTKVSHDSYRNAMLDAEINFRVGEVNARSHWARRQLALTAVSYFIIFCCACMPFACWVQSSGEAIENRVAFFELFHSASDGSDSDRKTLHSKSTLLASAIILTGTTVCAVFFCRLTFRVQEGRFDVSSTIPLQLLFLSLLYPIYSTVLSFPCYKILFHETMRRNKSLAMRFALKHIDSDRTLLSIPSRIFMFYKRNFDFEHGKNFYIFHGIMEIFETLVQCFTLQQALPVLDYHLAAYIALTISLNTLISPLLLLSKKKNALIAFDCFIDILYIIFNLARFLYAASNQNVVFTSVDALSVGLPTLSITFLLHRFMKSLLAQRIQPSERISSPTENKRSPSPTENKRSSKTRSIKDALKSRFGAMHNSVLIRCVRILFLLFCFTIGCTLLVCTAGILSVGNDCSRAFPNVVWGAMPVRTLQIDPGFFSSRSCEYVTRFVSTLDLRGANLTEIGNWIHKLESLERIDLRQNGNLRSIEHLVMAITDASSKLGTIELPPLRMIKSLDLSARDIIRFPAVLSILEASPNLESLDLSLNVLSSNEVIAPVLSAVKSRGLRVLNISNNGIRQVPGALVDFARERHLDFLGLSQNNITSAGVEFRAFSSTNVDLSGNPIQEIIVRDFPFNLSRALQFYKTLEIINLRKAVGVIPTQLGLLSNLRELFLVESLNETTLPTEIGLLTKLTRLDIADSRIIGTIPKEIGALTHLERLSLANAMLTGTIPSEVCNCTDLWQISLDRTGISGTLPECIIYLNMIRSFHLHNTHIVGSLPSEVTNWAHLVSISLPASMNGTLPGGLGQLKHLELLGIYSDGQKSHITGVLPKSLSETPLSTIIIPNSPLHGPIPVHATSLLHLCVVNSSNLTLTDDQNAIAARPCSFG